jgi:hypothetical protein
MKSYVILLFVFLGLIVASCKKKSTPVSHTVKYIASADTFIFNVTYTDSAKHAVTMDSVLNGWTKTFTITNQSGFPASLKVMASPGRRVTADIYVDQVHVADSTSYDSTGTVTTSYKVP